MYVLNTNYPVQNLTHFAMNAPAFLQGKIVPAYKTNIEKFIYIVKNTFDSLLPIFTRLGLNDLPKFVKILLLIVGLLSPLIFGMIWFYLADSAKNENKEEENLRPDSIMKVSETESPFSHEKPILEEKNLITPGGNNKEELKE